VVFLSEKETDFDEKALEKEVGGEYTTFKIYCFLLKTKEASIRDVYHGANLSSPSLALHHLEKLETLKLVRKDERGVYHVIPRRFGILKFFIRTGKWLVPRSFYYTLFYASLAITSLLVFPPRTREVAVVFSAIGIATNLIDTLLFLKLVR
jgi:hypothetical protein